jgi:ADP-ribose pyrophosphatase YjhB (NUDIX family)
MPRDEYIASLARKRMAAMALFHDDLGRVLLVNPTYMDEWLLPGGSVEADESPHAACRREVVEETGLDRAPGRIVAVDWVPARSGRRIAACLKALRSGEVLSLEDGRPTV